MPRLIHRLIGAQSHTKEMNRLTIKKCNCTECGTYGTYRFKGGFDLPTSLRIAASYRACDGMSDPKKQVAELIELAKAAKDSIDKTLSNHATTILTRINRI
jgi:hypothetical protein